MAEPFFLIKYCFPRDEDGHYHITGRMDDVINVTGHRLGTAEVEDAMVRKDDVIYVAVVLFRC